MPHSFVIEELGLDQRAHLPFAGSGTSGKKPTSQLLSLPLCEGGVREVMTPPPLIVWAWG